jgi:hypothetical protein
MTRTADRQTTLGGLEPAQRTTEAQRRADAPLRPTKPQNLSTDGLALFGDVQLDLVDAIRASERSEPTSR